MKMPGIDYVEMFNQDQQNLIKECCHQIIEWKNLNDLSQANFIGSAMIIFDLFEHPSTIEILEDSINDSLFQIVTTCIQIYTDNIGIAEEYNDQDMLEISMQNLNDLTIISYMLYLQIIKNTYRLNFGSDNFSELALRMFCWNDRQAMIALSACLEKIIDADMVEDIAKMQDIIDPVECCEKIRLTYTNIIDCLMYS